jgi:hypothetical protein
MRIRSNRLMLAIGVSVVLVIAGLSPASAAGTRDSLDAATLVAAIPGISKGVSVSGTSMIQSASVGVMMRAGMEQQQVTLAAPGRAFSRISTQGGSRTFENTDTSVDTVVQTLNGGARILEVIRSADAPTSFNYQISLVPGEAIKQIGDGSLIIGKLSTEGSNWTMETTGLIGAPWAIDAKGESVPASYVIQGNSIQMRVSHSKSVSYPVVADPTFTRAGMRVSWSVFDAKTVTVLMNKSLSEDFGYAKGGVCGLVNIVPIIGTAVSIICGLSLVLDAVAYHHGYCTKLTFNLVNRTARYYYYRGGFCK